MKTQNSLERIFHYQDRAVRTLMMGGEPWFVAKDVCAALGIVNSRAALDGLEEDEIASVGITDTSPRAAERSPYRSSVSRACIRWC